MHGHDNDTAQLVAELVAALPPDEGLPRMWIERAVDATRLEGGHLGNRAALLSRARELALANRGGRRSSFERRPGVTATQQQRSLTQRAERDLVDGIRSMVARFRQAAFGSSDAPFPKSLTNAAKWIEKHSRPQFGAPEEAMVADALAQAAAACERANAEDPWRFHSVSSRPQEVEYWRPDGSINVRHVSRDEEPLASLAQWAELTAEATQLPRAACVAAVLTALEPGQLARLSNGKTERVPGLAVFGRRHLNSGRRADGAKIPNVEQVVIWLDVRELTDLNLRHIRQQILGPTAARALRITIPQERVLRAVHKAGGPPTKRFDRSFWDLLAKKLSRADPIALARQYYRAVKSGPMKTSKGGRRGKTRKG